jgi:hypothetical protein
MEKNHALENAKGWMDTINEWCLAMDMAEDSERGHDERIAFDGNEYDTADELREHAQEMALSVACRCGWYCPGGDGQRAEPKEYQVLLSTGGPALRIVGELSEHCEPTSARLEHQDWGTPWTEYHEADSDNLLRFASVFYFGE